MSLVSYFFSSRQAVVLGASACVALSSVLFSLSGGNRAPEVASSAPGAMTAPDVPAAAPAKVAAVAVAPLAPSGATSLRTGAAPSSPAKDPQSDPVAQLQAPRSPDIAAPRPQDIRLGSMTDKTAKTAHTPPVRQMVVASTNPTAPAVETAPLAKPEVGGAVDASPDEKLKFDLVRVDKAGSAVVAGKATPGQMVVVKVDGVATAKVKTNNRGGFVALFDVPASEKPQIISLAARDGEGVAHPSSEQVIVVGRKAEKPVAVAADVGAEVTTTSIDAPPAPQKDVAPAIILTSDAGVKVVQPAAPETDAPEVMANVSLDLISYDSSGEVVLTGRGKPDRHVRVYVDGKPVKTNPVDKNGSWQLSLPEVDAGRYTLRIDEIDSQGQVTSRLETPFQKEGAAAVNRVASNGDLATAGGASTLPKVQKVTIQRGATLWALAQKSYGKGQLYMQIFNANRDTIRDPNLIYPGQIFKIPE